MTKSISLRKKIESLLLSFKPDIISFEQVFPYIGLKDILSDLGLNPKIIYNSQNVEAPMRKNIMEIAGASYEAISQAFKKIHTSEVELATKADLVAAVSREDCNVYNKYSKNECIIAQNGINKSLPSDKSINYWKSLFSEDGIDNIYLFVGSGHLPNMNGIKKMIGFRVGFVSSNSKIVIAGGAGTNLKQNFNNNDVLSAPYWRRVLAVGLLSQDMLDGLIGFADVMLIPIADGGGSNLKTAEAILNDKKIVATSFAFRGYEDYLELPNIWIADSQEDFVKAITVAHNTQKQPRTSEEHKLANRVQWEHTLAPLMEKAVTL
jgi:hypothetical protein